MIINIILKFMIVGLLLLEALPGLIWYAFRGFFYFLMLMGVDMKAIKKINNNVALCVDGNNKELIAFGKGIGFPSMPYEIDLGLISMTFYRIEKLFYDLIKELPGDVLETSALIVKEAQSELQCNLNPNLVISLADHINFAIIRMKKYKNMKLLFSFDVEQFYPKETALGKFAVKLIQKNLNITLPDSEITNIAMHFVNAEEEQQDIKNLNIEEFISDIANRIESTFFIKADRNGFIYNRFAVHLRYFIKRIKDKEQFHDENAALADAMMESYPEVYQCALEIRQMINDKFDEQVDDDELLYLMIHINRIIQNTMMKD